MIRLLFNGGNSAYLCFIPEQLENRYGRDEYFYPYRYRQSLRVTAEGIWTLKRSVTVAVAGIGRQF